MSLVKQLPKGLKSIRKKVLKGNIYQGQHSTPHLRGFQSRPKSTLSKTTLNSGGLFPFKHLGFSDKSGLEYKMKHSVNMHGSPLWEREREREQTRKMAGAGRWVLAEECEASAKLAHRDGGAPESSGSLFVLESHTQSGVQEKTRSPSICFQLEDQMLV
jgi:hypothetical protein